MFHCHFQDLWVHLWFESSRYGNWHYIKHGFCKQNTILNQDNVEFIVYDNVIKNVGNFEGVSETTGSTVVNGDRKFEFSCGLACSSGKSTKKSNRFVIRGVVVKITIEVTEMVFEGRVNMVVAFHD